jgi:hypothetical protein
MVVVVISVELTRAPLATPPPSQPVVLLLCDSPSLCPECDVIWRWCGQGSDEPALELCPGCEEAC